MVESFIPSIIVSLLLGGSLFLLIYAIFRFPVSSEPPVHRRVAAALGVGDRQTVFENPITQPIMSMGVAIAQRCNLPTIRGRIRQDLNASGNPSGYSVDEYLSICIMCAIGMGIAVILIEFLFVTGVAFFALPVMMAIGFGIPYYSLNSEAHKRTILIAKQLPYTLDLIALTMAAGSTFPEAIETVVRDRPEDHLNQELAIVQSEIQFGTTRSQALRNLADRVPLETLRSIVGAINQAEDLGTPLSAILKEQATILRNNRSVRAEKLSASASLRILVPSMLILFGAVLIVFGPVIVGFINKGSLF